MYAHTYVCMYRIRMSFSNTVFFELLMRIFRSVSRHYKYESFHNIYLLFIAKTPTEMSFYPAALNNIPIHTTELNIKKPETSGSLNDK